MAMSGQKTVTSGDTAEQLGSQQISGSLMVKALLANTGNVYVGNDGTGDVASGTGMELDAGEVIIFSYVGNLESIWIDADEDGEGVAWLALDVM
jgi:hypothetical protein